MSAKDVSQMEVIHEDINGILQRLQLLKGQVDDARAALRPLEAGLAIAEREYTEHTGSLRNTINRLHYEIRDLDEQIERLNGPAVVETPTEPLPLDTDLSSDESLVTPEPSVDVGSRKKSDPDALEKDKLMEHLFVLLDGTADAAGSELIWMMTGLCTDPKVTLGDALEQLPWGIAWSARRPSESLTDQYRRLGLWETTLTSQLAMLRRGEERLRSDNRYGLYRQRKQGQAVWRAWLEQANLSLQADIADLEAQIEERRKLWEHKLKAQ